MNDLEQEIRRVLDEEARSAPPPHDRERIVRRTRRRQGLTIAAGLLGTAAVVAVSVATLRAVLTNGNDLVPGDEPTTTTTMNGVTITHPQSWAVIDPDEAGLNGPTRERQPTPEVPRLILALAPFDPGEAFGCPGLVDDVPHTFLMTIREEPLDLTGRSSNPWPVELEPMGVDAAESGCYPGWEFLRAGWSAAGRTFEARVGLAPDVSATDRASLMTVFASLTFERATDAATAIVLATGTTGGEDWELIAERQGEELMLSLETETFGTGAGGFDASGGRLIATSAVLGNGADALRIVFGAAPSEAVRVDVGVSGEGPDAPATPEILDIPDEIDPNLNAFVFTIGEGQRAVITAYDDTGSAIASGEVGSEVDEPIETPLPGDASPTPAPDEVVFTGRTNECEWTLTRSSVSPRQDRFDLATSDDVQVGFVADMTRAAPPIQMSSYTCAEPPGGTLVFGLLTDEVRDVQFPTSAPDEHARPECWEADIADHLCLFLLDGAGDAGDVIVFDADGNEIGRAGFP